MSHRSTTGRRLTMRGALAVLVTTGLVTANCGGGDDAPSAEPADDTGAAETTAGETASADAPATTAQGAAPITGLATTTPAGTQPVDRITWALYRDVANLDPVQAFDYPENTVLAILCESPLRQAPDGTIAPGLADLSTPDELTLVLDIREGAAFWNGDPVTADDVAFSLNRNLDPAVPSFYGVNYANVESIVAADADTVTVTLTQPDALVQGVLASPSAWVVQRSFVESAGADFGNPTGRTMCSGSYQLGDWQTGSPLSAVRNDNYWRPEVEPLVAQIDFIGAPDPIALSAALQAGDVNGYYAFASIPTLQQLQADSNVTVTAGSGRQLDAFIVGGGEGTTLGDPKAREALSLALDRQAYIDNVLAGGGQIPRSFATPGTWGYAPEVFQAAYDELPPLEQNLDAAKALAEEAGLAGKSITLGLISEVPPMVAEAALFQQAAEELGMTVELRPFPADQYISLFIDPAAREGIDGWFTVIYPDVADPAAFFGQFGVPGGVSNYSGYENPEVTRLLADARSTADDIARAELVVQAQALLMQDLPYIPVAHPHNLLITSSNLSGAVASFTNMVAPWADDLGGV
jgi:peptide/nickel transport system substrate-binding protein